MTNYIKKIFWQSFNRIVGKIREKEDTLSSSAGAKKENIEIDSDMVYLKSESSSKQLLLSHFVLLLDNDVINSIQYYYVRTNCQNYN